MNVAGLQLDMAWENPGETFKRVRPLAGQAVRQGARLLVLPEMFATGFSMNTRLLNAHAQEINDFLSVLAKELNVAVVAGYADEDPSVETGRRGRNFAVAYDSRGCCIAKYQKIHPFSYGKENEHYLGGSSLTHFELEGLRITPFVCYDLRFPEIFRAAASRSDLMIVIANWPIARRDAWRTLLRARAIENQCYVLGVNRFGEGDGLHYSGDSALIDPLGECLSELEGEAGLVLGEVSAAKVRETRERFPFLNDRRPEVYAKLGGGMNDPTSIE